MATFQVTLPEVSLKNSSTAFSLVIFIVFYCNIAHQAQLHLSYLIGVSDDEVISKYLMNARRISFSWVCPIMSWNARVKEKSKNKTVQIKVNEENSIELMMRNGLFRFVLYRYTRAFCTVYTLHEDAVNFKILFKNN